MQPEYDSFRMVALCPVYSSDTNTVLVAKHLRLLSVAVINTVPKNDLGEKVYFSLQLQSSTKGRQDKNLRYQVEATEELASHYLLCLIFYTIQDHTPRDGSTRLVLCPPASILNKENVPQASLQATEENGPPDSSQATGVDPHLTLPLLR